MMLDRNRMLDMPGKPFKHTCSESAMGKRTVADAEPAAYNASLPASATKHYTAPGIAHLGRRAPCLQETPQPHSNIRIRSAMLSWP